MQETAVGYVLKRGKDNIYFYRDYQRVLAIHAMKSFNVIERAKDSVTRYHIRKVDYSV